MVKLLNYDIDYYDKIEYASRASTNSKAYRQRAGEKILKDVITDIGIITEIYRRAEEKSKKFIKVLVERGHVSIGRHSTVSFELIMSRSASIQFVRSANIGTVQESQRYVTFDRDFYTPQEIKENREANSIYNSILKQIKFAYKDLLEIGIKKEDARMILPNCCYTRLVVNANLQAWLDFVTLRNNPETQEELREIAKEMFEILCEKIPEYFEYFREKDGTCIKKWSKKDV
jgi:thymidylate synthase (FAD)